MSKIFGNNDQNDLYLATHHVRKLDTTYPFSVKTVAMPLGSTPPWRFRKGGRFGLPLVDVYGNMQARQGNRARARRLD